MYVKLFFEKQLDAKLEQGEVETSLSRQTIVKCMVARSGGGHQNPWWGGGNRTLKNQKLYF